MSDDGVMSNRIEDGAPFSRETLGLAIRRLSVCGICGRSTKDARRVKMIAGWITHAACSKGLTDDAYRNVNG